MTMQRTRYVTYLPSVLPPGLTYWRTTEAQGGHHWFSTFSFQILFSTFRDFVFHFSDFVFHFWDFGFHFSVLFFTHGILFFTFGLLFSTSVGRGYFWSFHLEMLRTDSRPLILSIIDELSKHERVRVSTELKEIHAAWCAISVYSTGPTTDF